MQNYPVNFKANIRLVSANKFAQEIANVSPKHYVNLWTLDGMVVGEKPYTDKIYDCVTTSVMGPDKIAMVHMSPYYESNGLDIYKKNEDFKPVEEALLEVFGGSIKGLDSLVLGNKTTFPESNDLFEKALSCMKKNGTNCSVIRGLKNYSPTSVAGDIKTRSWIITNDYIASQLKKGVQNLKGILERCFHCVDISKKDTLSRN